METMVSIWFGNFETEAALLEYTTESYTEDGDKVSSMFCKEFFDGEEPYEVALFERYSIEDSSADIHVLLEGCSYDESVIHSLISKVGEKLDKEYNSVILTFDFAAESAIKQLRGQVDYIATVPYKKMQ